MSYLSEIQADNPLAHWRVGENSGSTLVDSSGNGKHGSYTGSPVWTFGLVNGDSDKAIVLNGSTQRADTPAFSGASDPDYMTVSVIFRPSILGVQQVLHARANESGTNQVTFKLYVTSGNKLAFKVRVGGTDYTATGSTSLVRQYKHHLAGTFDGTNVKVWVNGVVDGTTAASGTLTKYGASLGGLIGAGYNGSIVDYTNGVLDEIAYFGSALSGARLLAQAAQVGSLDPSKDSAFYMYENMGVASDVLETITKQAYGWGYTPNVGGTFQRRVSSAGTFYMNENVYDTATTMTMRGSRQTTSASTGTVNVLFPTGTVAGDTAVFMVAAAFDLASAPTGATVLFDDSGGSNISCWVYKKVLDAADITNGGLNFNFGAGGWMTATCYTFAGSVTVELVTASRSISVGAGTITTGIISIPPQGVAIYDCHVSSATSQPSVNHGTIQQNVTAVADSGRAVSYAQSRIGQSSGENNTVTYTYPAAAGLFVSAVRVSP